MEKLRYIDVKRNFEKHGYKLISRKYINRRHKLVYKDKCGYYYWTIYSSTRLAAGWKPEKFYKKNPNVIKNMRLWIKLNKKPFTLISKKYDSKTRLILRCHVCKEKFSLLWGSITAGQGCSVCRGFKVVKKTSLQYLRPDLAKEWSCKNTISPRSVPLFSRTKVIWECFNGHEWVAPVSNRTKNQTGCPVCKQISKGERRIRNFLDSKNIEYIPQFRFKDCKNKRSLPFDFYVPSSNILIEFNGIQHYSPVERFGGDVRFKEVVKNDKIKYKYAKKNGITLVLIDHKRFNEIEIVLEKVFN